MKVQGYREAAAEYKLPPPGTCPHGVAKLPLDLGGAGMLFQASFGAPGTRAALTCAQHKLSSYIDVRSRRCREPGCARQPSFYNSSQPSVLLCSHHARAREEREERGAGEAGAESGGGNVRGDRAEVAEPAVLPHCLSPVRRGKGLVLSLVRARVHAE